MDIKKEAIMLIVVLIALLLIIFVFFIFTYPQLQEIRGREDLTFKERSEKILNSHFEVLPGLNIFSQIFIGMDEGKMYEFFVTIASLILFVIIFLNILELTSLKGWQIASGTTTLTVLSGFSGFFRLVGTSFFSLFNFLKNPFYQIVSVFLFFILLMYLFSFLSGLVKENLEKE